MVLAPVFGNSNMKAVKQPWDKTGEDEEILHSLLLSGELKMDAKPRQVLDMVPHWSCYEQGSFRAAYNRIRKKVERTLKMQRPPVIDEKLDAIKPYVSGFAKEACGPTTTFATIPFAKLPIRRCNSSDDEDFDGKFVNDAKQYFAKQKIVALNNDSSNDLMIVPKPPTTMVFVQNQTVNAGNVAGLQQQATASIQQNQKVANSRIEHLIEVTGKTRCGTTFIFTPIFLQWEYQDDDMVQCIGITMALPSGVGENGDLSRSVFTTLSDDGTTLIVKCAWPSNLRSFGLLKMAMLQDGVKAQTVDSMIKGIRSEIFGIKQSLSSDFIGCTAKIALNKVCDKEIVKETALTDPRTQGLQLTIILRVAGQPPVVKKRKSLVVQRLVIAQEDLVMDE